MNPQFTAEFFSNNRQNLLKLSQSSRPIVIAAHGLLQRGGDSTYTFHQDSNFWYLTGLNEPDLILVIDGDEEYLLVPGRSTSREAFDGTVDFDALTNISGIKQIMDEEDGWKKLGARLKTDRKVQTLTAPPMYIEQYGMYTNPARARLIERLQSWSLTLEINDIREPLVSLRAIKQPVELAALQAAIDVTIDGIRYVTGDKRLSKYGFEYEIESDLSSKFRTEIASGHAFAPIVAGGKRAVTLHNVENNGSLNVGDLVVIDVGSEVSHYAADITRTVALGTPTKRQLEVFEAVLDVQKYALKLLKPGALLKEYEARVEEYMSKKLINLGLITEGTRENIRKYYPHATSHFLGLDVHDVGDYAQPLESGMVLTCEPGIYITEESIGVRIEDDILITENGNKVLSDTLPRSLTANG
jgi:Xaa-Pro aminopeptidase